MAPTVAPEELALQAVHHFLETELGRPLSDLNVSYGRGQWEDSNLGCSQAGKEAIPGDTAGFQFDVVVG